MGADMRDIALCRRCVKSKVKQKNVKSISNAKKAVIPGQRPYFDLSKLTVKSSMPDHATINRDNWKVLVCKATGKKGVTSL